MADWTPEPWAADLDRWKNIAFVSDEGERQFVAFYAKKPDAARIVQCVNACAGLPDPAAALERARDALRWCADELAAEIEARYRGPLLEYPSYRRRYDADMEPVHAARAALAALTPTPEDVP